MSLAIARLAMWLWLFLTTHAQAHIRLEAPELHTFSFNSPSFVRSAVESKPAEELMQPLARFTMAPTFGDVFLPLRSAVESVPTVGRQALAHLEESPGLRSFIRDSVESLPEDDAQEDNAVEPAVAPALRNFADLDEMKPEKLVDIKQSSAQFQPPSSAPWIFSDKYAAYVEPSKQNEFEPQPFRADSPYQQLVTAAELEQLAHAEDFEVVQEQLDYSPMPYDSSVEGNQEELAPYGALAEFKSTKKNYNSESIVLCYFSNWAFYRAGDGQFVPEQLDNKLCSALVYSFASLDPDLLSIKEFDPWVDVENQYYQRAVDTGIPVLIALGGWTDSTGDKYSRLAADDIKRKVFASNLVGFLQRHRFAGLHLDWNYPKCWQSDCTKGPASDKPNLTKLLREIRAEFLRVDKRLQLGVAISGYKEIIEEAYELAELSKIVDYMTVMSYDYHGAWERQTGHVSPLYGRQDDKYPQYNTDYALQLLLKKGARREKIIVGIPFYGQTFTLERSSNSLVGEGVPTSGPGEPGEFTKQPGMLAYFEICQLIRKKRWLSGRDAQHKSGPYAMLKNQWVGFDDPASVEAKARYAVNNGFGGVAAWTIDLDDFQNSCCGEAFPLLKSINRAIGRMGSPPPTRENCARPPKPVTPVPPVMTTVSSDGSSGSPPQEQPSTTSSPWQSSTSTPWTSTTSTTARTSTVWWTPTSKPSASTTSTTRRTTSKPSASTTSTTRRTTTKRTTRPTYQPAATTLPSPTMEGASEQPVSCEPGNFYPDNGNCNAYYHCVKQGELKQQFCPGGLHWNRATNGCDWPASAKCFTLADPLDAPPTAAPQPKPPNKITTARPTYRPSYLGTTSSSKPITSIRTTRRPKPSTNKPSARCNEGEYYSHSTCNQYYICINGALVPNGCGGNLHWDAIRKTCDWPENVKCVTTRQYLRSQAYRVSANPDDPCDGNDRVPYPGDCTKFLICLWNRLQESECGPGLHFNAATGLCDWPLSANCKESGNEGSNELVPGGSGGSSVQPLPTTERPLTTAKPTYPTDKPNLQPLNGYYKIVCYFTNWAWYRKGLGRYTPDDINSDLCTHVVYGFAVLDYSELIIRTHDSWADIDNNFYTRVSGLKSKGIKVSLALGGWNDSQGDKYSRLVRNPAARRRFINHALEFIEKYGFEGLDLDWEYPVCWQTECQKGMPDEKQAFTALVRELSEAFRPRNLLLSTAVSPSKKIIDLGYEVSELARYFDWIAVMTYDFHGQWDKKTGHVAPLYYHPDDDYEYFNTNFSINYWIEKGAPSRKIVMGMPLYGQSFTLENTQNNGLNAKAPGPGQAGEFTRAAGFLAYYEICDRIKSDGWEVVQDEYGRMGPYARKGNQWVSFDDPAMIRKKSQLVRALDLGGGMVWALDLDDFRNRCGDGVHPLLTQIHNVLKDPPQGFEPTPGLETQPPFEPQSPPDSPPPIETEPASSIEEQEIPIEAPNNELGNENIIDPNNEIEQAPQLPVTGTASASDFKVVCYFTNWAWYRQGGGKYLPEDIDPELCTHVVYGFAVLNRESLTIQPHDSWADLDNNFYARVVALRAKGIKVTVAIGGWNDSAGDKYARLVRNAAARARFVRHVLEFIEKHGFDGLDLDWEYPVCWQVDCKQGTPDEKHGFTALVRELSEVFKPKGLLLSSAVSPNKKVIDAGYDVPQLTRYFDWIAVMTYDYHGQWDKKTGHVAPMYEHPKGTETFNANFTINYWLQMGAERKKLIMGMPMYGQSFSLAQASDNDLNSPTYGGGEAGEATRARGFLSYYEICSYIRKRGWSVVRDPRGRMGPYAYLRDQWVSFDDIPMIKHKSEYISAMGLGGAMIWALDLDDFKNDCDCEAYPLLKTINRVLRNYPASRGECRLENEGKTMIAFDEGAPQAQTPKPTVASSDIDGDTYEGPGTAVSPVEPAQPTDCYGRNFVSHHRDCNKYFICQHGQLLEQRCPEGLHWNENYCDWPKNAQCNVNNELTTPHPTAAPTKPSKKPLPEKPTKKPLTRPKPTKPVSPLGSNEDYKVVCYFTNWAWYRRGEGKYVPEDIDENLCTHIVYGFAVLNTNTLTIRTHDSWADVDNRFYERVVAYKNKGIRVTLAIGGWNDSLGSKYARLVLDSEARARFIQSVLDFLEKYGFEGLDLDWEYPVCWQVDCTKGSATEKQGFAALVRELSIAFKPRGLLLSAAVSPSKMVIDAGYNVPVLSKYFDWIAVMTYDFHGHWDKQTGHVAPLYYVEGDSNEYFNANYSINYWLEKGAPAKKLIMGMPLYGQSFSLADTKQRDLNQKSIGPGQAGTYTRAAGFLAYYEICEKVNSGTWTVERDPEGRIGPYAYSGSQWVSYDDVADIRRKSRFVRSMGLGGGMVWALDLDDFRGRCGCGKHPLLRTLNQELRGIPGQRADDCT